MSFTNQKIPTGYARKLAQNYKHSKLGRPLKIDDTHAVWFERRTILDALGITTDPEPNSIFNGIRIYFGAYEEGPVQPNPIKKGKVTLILVQTRLAADRTTKDILEEPDALPGYPTGFEEYNDGQLCPPPSCDPDGLWKNV